ncbi:MAG: DUF1492 domain-containing protein [Clostridia bacterium]
MKAKEYLSDYENLERRLSAKLEKIAEYKAMSTSISILFGEKVQTTKQTNGTEKVISLYMDLQNEIMIDIRTIKQKLHNIRVLIKKLDDTQEKTVLERKYINGQTWPEISQKMFLSERQIIRIHGKALENLQKIIDKKLE